MESLYHQTNKLIQETQNHFSKWENAGGSTEHIENEILTRIQNIDKNCEKLDILLFKEPFTRRGTGKMRIDQLKYDNQHLKAALRSIQEKRFRFNQELRDREELLNRRFTTNSLEPDTTILIDHSLQHHNSLNNANRGIDDMLRTGQGVLENLKAQRDTIKGTHRRILDIANTLGLSNSTMRFIERRAYQDKFVLLGGIIITLFIVAIVVIYV